MSVWVSSTLPIDSKNKVERANRTLDLTPAYESLLRFLTSRHALLFYLCDISFERIFESTVNLD